MTTGRLKNDEYFHFPLTLTQETSYGLQLTFTNPGGHTPAIDYWVKSTTGRDLYGKRVAIWPPPTITGSIELLGNLEPEFHPATLVLFGQHLDSDYEIGSNITQRPGANDAGTSLPSAVSVSSGAVKVGNIRGEQVGHFYQIPVPVGSTLTVTGSFANASNKAQSLCGAQLLDSTGAILINHFLQQLAKGSTPVTSTNTFTNTGINGPLILHMDNVSNGFELEVRYSLTFTVTP